MSNNTAPETPKKDHWSTTAYQSSAAFVPTLATKVISLLNPQRGERILDIGCGDGTLTFQIAKAVGPDGAVLGLDNSSSFITHATSTYDCGFNLQFELQDCAQLEETTEFVAKHAGSFDKIFSNAALHWILRDPGRRLPTLRTFHALLKPGGSLVFEMGGAGNVSEAHAALVYALLHRGFSIKEARDTNPWFFPSAPAMIYLLGSAGFTVSEQDVGLEYRATRMEEKTDQGGGLQGWIRLMGATFLEKLPVEERDAAVEEVCDVLKDMCSRPDGEHGEGGEWLGYVRCRGIAKRSITSD